MTQIPLQSRFKQDFTRIRYSAGSYVDGRYVDGVMAATNYKGSVQPFVDKGSEVIQRLAEGDRTKKIIVIYTYPDTLRTVDEKNSYKADLVYYEGETYEVQRVNRWAGQILTHDEVWGIECDAGVILPGVDFSGGIESLQSAQVTNIVANALIGGTITSDNPSQVTDLTATVTLSGDVTSDNAAQYTDAVGDVDTFSGAWTTLGNSASFPGGTAALVKLGADNFNSTDLAIIDDTSDVVRLQRFTSPNWGNVGSTYSLSGLTAPGICVLPNGTAVIFKSNATAGLIALSHNGSSYAQVGNQLNVTGSNQGIALVALPSGNFVLLNSLSDIGQEYSFDGTNFSTVGSSFALGSVNGVIQGDALSSTLIIVVDASTNNAVLYEKGGGTWSAVSGGSFSVNTALGVATIYPSICSLGTGADVLVGGELGKVQAMRWNGSSWSTFGSSYTVPNTSSSGTTALVHMGDLRVAFMRASTTNSFLRMLQGS